MRSGGLRRPTIWWLTAAALGIGLGLVAQPGSAGAGPQATAARYCGKVDIGFTTAKVRARNVRCSTARRFVRLNSSVKRNCTEANDYCRVTYYRGYRCVTSGNELTVKVSCRKGSRVISETHGE
jgi:hypothetical protein